MPAPPSSRHVYADFKGVMAVKLEERPRARVWSHGGFRNMLTISGQVKLVEPHLTARRAPPFSPTRATGRSPNVSMALV